MRDEGQVSAPLPSLVPGFRPDENAIGPGQSIYRFFRPNFRLQSLGNPLSESLEIYCASRPDYGPLSIKISSDSDKRYPSYCRWKFEIISQ